MSNLQYSQVNDDPSLQSKICEICGSEFIMCYGYSIAACWLVTGHAYVSGFMCEQSAGGQHWGCTPEHAVEAMLTCLQEHHGISRLTAKHQEMADDNKERLNPEHEHLKEAYEKDQQNFHIIRRPNNGN